MFLSPNISTDVCAIEFEQIRTTNISELKSLITASLHYNARLNGRQSWRWLYCGSDIVWINIPFGCKYHIIRSMHPNIEFRNAVIF